MNHTDSPLWDLSPIYTSLTSEEYRKDLESIDMLYHLLKRELDAFNVTEDHMIRLLETYGNLSDTHETLDAYVHACLSVETTGASAVQGIHDVARKGLLVKKGRTEMVLAIAPHAQEITSLLSHCEVLEPFAYAIEQLLLEASHLMAPQEEALAYALQTTGADAFSRLQEVLTSTSSIRWDESGEMKTLTELRALAFHPERKVRRKAYLKELELLKTQELPLSFALNGVKGTALTLYKKRRYPDALSCALDASRITSGVLTSLISSIEQRRGVFNRYFKAKAHLLGLPVLSFYDLFAPVGTYEKNYTFTEARELITSALGSFHLPMGEAAEYAFENGWIDASIRPGKVGGAFCTFFPLRRESRILCNFDGSFDALSTVAHELGHAYHDTRVKDLPSVHRAYPMTLAETASIFSQFIIFNETRKTTEGEQRLSLLDSFLQDASQVCVDILSRFYFEQALFDVVATGEASADDLNEMMESAQKRAYGDGLNPRELHRYMWAVKGHYYSADLPFYNYPYAFGQLFALGLYREYEKDPEGFPHRFDVLLSYSGQADASRVTDTVGCDIRTPVFWLESLDVIERYVDEFAALAGYGAS
ncbi:MAG: M3 family oligoendopeptidase [Sphaerochaetaceae bacterium]|nr:M3 family oligoendopeptidase [Sphaerochaetaceae bacterium]